MTQVVTLSFAWSSPSGRVKAVYRAEVLRREVESDRCVCRLLELVGVERSGSSEEVSDAALRALIDKCVRVPGEALNGLTLPLKMATLTGGLTRPYFFDEE